MKIQYHRYWMLLDTVKQRKELDKLEHDFELAYFNFLVFVQSILAS